MPANLGKGGMPCRTRSDEPVEIPQIIEPSDIFTMRITAPCIRKLCPNCGKPLVLTQPPGGKGPRMWWCLECDNPIH